MKKIVFFFAIIAAIVSYGHSTHAATLNIVSESGSIAANTEFALNIKVDSESATVNAVQTTVLFPKDVFEAVRVDKTGSVFTFWLEEPTIDAENGMIRFTTGSTSGLSGKSLQVLRMVFRMKGSGSAEIQLSNSAVTAADGAGTNVLTKSSGLKIVAQAPTGESQEVPLETPIIPKPAQISRPPVMANTAPRAPSVTVPFYPDPTAWHNLSSPFLAQWELPADTSAVAAVINKDPGFAPTTSEGLFDNKMFPALADGVNYLHVRFRNNQGWGTTAHYRLAVDTAPPVEFDITVIQGNPSEVPNPSLSYKSADQLSGISRYAISVGNGEKMFTEESSQTLALLAPGTYTVRVAAEDRAGNSSEKTLVLEILPIDAPILGSITHELFIGEGNLFASGTVDPAFSILATLTDGKGARVDSLTITPGKTGLWSANFDKPLKRGTYTLTLVSLDARGAQSFPVKETIVVRPRPLLTLFGVGISPVWFYAITTLLLVGAIVAGIYIERRRKKQRDQRILVIERDTTNLIQGLKKDMLELGKIIADSKDANAGALTDRINQKLRKIETYVMEDIEEINR